MVVGLSITRRLPDGLEPVDELARGKLSEGELGRGFEFCESLLLHAQIDLHVAMSSRQLRMPEPGRDGRDVDARPQQVHRSCVSNHVRRESPSVAWLEQGALLSALDDESGA